MIDMFGPRPITKALSIRQPWAWLILHAGKDIENRDWKPGNRDLSFRGDFYIHVGRNLYGTAIERESIRAWARRTFNVVVPSDDELATGGIVGQANVIDVVRASSSPWFTGPYGLVLADVRPLPFKSCSGKLGFFACNGESFRR
jgi:hypothetical protein